MIVAAAFQCIVRALYNLLVVQFATSVSCKLSVDEQKAWLAKDQAAGCTKLESLLSRVIGLLSGSLVFYRDMLDSQRPAVCIKQCLYLRHFTLLGHTTWKPCILPFVLSVFYA